MEKKHIGVLLQLFIVYDLTAAIETSMFYIVLIEAQAFLTFLNGRICNNLIEIDDIERTCNDFLLILWFTIEIICAHNLYIKSNLFMFTACIGKFMSTL